ncbi:MAG: hypothetical protein KGD64_08930 [Candidatus Heimdallarchaeota archaeon]|nr:hypothetical protein [Candidatus Heimdallarchaeota archaeon]
MNAKQINKKTLLLGGLLAMIVISSFLYTPVLGESHDDDEDEDDDGISDRDEDENRRKVEIEYSDSEVQIESSQEIDGISNEFKVKIETGDEGIKIKFEFEKDNETLETEVEYKVVLSEIIEFIDTSADGFYNSSIDQEVQVLKIDEFKPILYTTELILNDTVHIFTVETVDEVFSATVYVTTEFTVINDVIVAPNQLKIDIGIHNFNYTELDSVLALKVKLESEYEVDYENDDETEDEEDGRASDEQEVEIIAGDYIGFFSWIETAMVDGVEHAVKATPIETSEGENKMYLSYPRGTEIIHDPKVGIANIIQTPTGLVGSSEILIVSVAAILTITGLSVLFRKKSKR